MSPAVLGKFSGQMDAQSKKALDEFAQESGMTLSAIYTEMAELYLRSKRIRPAVISAAELVMREDRELLERLAK
jgi:hypothetical protein